MNININVMHAVSRGRKSEQTDVDTLLESIKEN